jgi:hypothetical protein
VTTELAPSPASQDATPALDDSLLIPAESAVSTPATEPTAAPTEEPAPVESPPPPAEPVLQDTLAKAAQIQRGEDVTLTAAEVRQLQRYDQSQKDQEVNWSRAEEQRTAQVNNLATAHTTAKASIKTTISTLVNALTGQDVKLDDLTQRGLDASIDPLIDNLARNAEHIVLEPLMDYFRKSVMLTAENLGMLTTAEKRRIASLDEAGVLAEAFKLGQLHGSKTASTPKGKVLIDETEYNALKTAQANEQRANEGERVPPRPSLPRSPDGKPMSQIALAGGGLPYDSKALQAELDALDNVPLIPR